MKSAHASRLLRKLGPVVALLLVTILFSALRPKTFATGDNLELILLQTAVVGTAAIGMTLVIVSGGIDLSIGSTIALSTVVIARILKAGNSQFAAVLGGIGAGLAAGFLIGFLITRLKLPPFIVTLGTLGAYRGFAKGLADEQVVNVDVPPAALNSVMSTIGPDTRWKILPTGVWITLALGVLVALMLRYTRFGRHLFAVGSNEATARLCGVPVDRTKVALYTLGAGFAGIAGVLQFAYQGQGDPTTAAGYELNAIAAVVIGGASLSGGQGSILGSLLGATIMTVITVGCTKMGYSNWVQEIVTGAIIVAAVALDRLRHRAAS